MTNGDSTFSTGNRKLKRPQPVIPGTPKPKVHKPPVIDIEAENAEERRQHRPVYDDEALEAEKAHFQALKKAANQAAKRAKKLKKLRKKARPPRRKKDVLATIPRITKEGRMLAPASGTDGLGYIACDNWLPLAVDARLEQMPKYQGVRIWHSGVISVVFHQLDQQRPYRPKKGKEEQEQRVNRWAKAPEEFQRWYRDTLWLVVRIQFLADACRQTPNEIRRHLHWLVAVGLAERAPGHVGEPVNKQKISDYGENTWLIRIKYELAFHDPVVAAWREGCGFVPDDEEEVVDEEEEAIVDEEEE